MLEQRKHMQGVKCSRTWYMPIDSAWAARLRARSCPVLCSLTQSLVALGFSSDAGVDAIRESECRSKHIPDASAGICCAVLLLHNFQ